MGGRGRRQGYSGEPGSRMGGEALLSFHKRDWREAEAVASWVWKAARAGLSRAASCGERKAVVAVEELTRAALPALQTRPPVLLPPPRHPTARTPPVAAVSPSLPPSSSRPRRHSTCSQPARPSLLPCRQTGSTQPTRRDRQWVRDAQSRLRWLRPPLGLLPLLRRCVAIRVVLGRRVLMVACREAEAYTRDGGGRRGGYLYWK